VDDPENQNTWDLGGPANAWAWDAVSSRPDGNTRVFELTKGKHILRIWTRENDSWLDCIYMSTDPNDTPVLPSEFVEAVTYAGKLATVWGRIKTPNFQ
jgi:hypothetical protein